MADKLQVLVVATRHRLPRYKLIADILARLPTVSLTVLANQWSMLEFIRRSWRQSATRQDWVIIHSAHLTAFVWAVLGRWRSGARVALWYGGNPLADMRSTFWPQVRRGQVLAALLPWMCLPLTMLAEKLATVIIVNNQPLADDLRQRLRQPPIVVIPQMVMWPAEAPPVVARAAPKVGQPWALLTVTNLQYQEKAAGVLWQMTRLAHLARSGALPGPVRHTILGDGVHLAALREQAAALAVAGRLEFVLPGFTRELVPYYLAADIFLYHSTIDGLASVLLEAAHAGLPLLVNRFPAHTHALRDQVEALFYDPAVPTEFDQHLRRLLGESDLRGLLGQRAQALVAARYSAGPLGSAWESLLHRGPEAVQVPPFPDYSGDLP